MRIPGLSSGMDTEQLIHDIMTAERIPVDRVYQQKIQAEWKRDAYRDVNTKLSQLRNMSFDLGLQSSFQQRVASSSHDNLVSVNASGRAQAGTYELRVDKLATSGQVIATDAGEKFDDFMEVFLEDDDDITFELRGLDGEMEQIVVTKEDTLESVLAKINNNKNIGIRAFHDSGKVSLTTTETGENAKIVVSDDESGFFNKVFGLGENETEIEDGVFEVASGKNAEVNINGLDLERESNSFDLDGITVNLQEVSNTTVRIEVKHDVDATVDKIKEFVDLYNSLVDEFNLMTREEVHRDFPPLTPEQKGALSEKEIELYEEKARSGLLRSDPIISNVLTEMRMALGGAVEGLEGNKSLSQIGIKTGSWYEYGKLYIDEDKLRTAIEEDPDNVESIFTNRSDVPSEKGLASRLTAALDKGMKRITDTAGKASVTYDQSFLGEQIRGLEDRLSAMEDRLIRIEANHWQKFTAMEKVLSQLYAQGDWLVQQLATMQGQ